MQEGLNFGAYSVRLSGQDSERGTFNQRHACYHDQRTGARCDCGAPVDGWPDKLHLAIVLCNMGVRSDMNSGSLALRCPPPARLHFECQTYQLLPMVCASTLLCGSVSGDLSTSAQLFAHAVQVEPAGRHAVWRAGAHRGLEQSPL